MDELWQRYRGFWTPVLIGVGVFLVGIIAIHVVTDDPEAMASTLRSERKRLGKKKVPSGAQIRAPAETADAMSRRVHARTDDATPRGADAWVLRLDQTGGAEGDVIEQTVDQALRAAILRGAPAALATEKTVDALATGHFDGDAVAAGQALRRFQRTRTERIELLRTADANVGFSRLLVDLDNELRQRANRADVDMRAMRLGFESVNNVEAADLPQRLLNLALVARIVNAAIVHGMYRIDHLTVDRPQAGSSDDFLREWSIKFTMAGPMAAAKRVVDHLTDPAAPVALHDTTLRIPKRNTTPLEGLVTLESKAFSVRIQADATVGFDEEDDE